MTGRRPLYIVLAVLLLLVVLPAMADAGSAGPSTARETGASPAAADTGRPATMQPGEGPVDRGGADPGTPSVRHSPASREPAVATTAAPARATVRAESGAATGSGSGTARTVGGATPRPEATPTLSPAASGEGTGGDGAGKATAGVAPTSARTALPPASLKNGGDGPGGGASDSMAPTVAPTAGAMTRSMVTGRDDAGSTAGTGSKPGSAGTGGAHAGTGGTSLGSVLERNPGPGLPAAAIESPDGTAVAPETDRHGRSGAGTASVSHPLSGPIDRAARGGPHPAVSPTPEHRHAGRLAGEVRAARSGRADGAGDDGTRGDHRSRNGEGRRGPPSFPASAPVAAPARIGLEPPGPGESGGGRGRKGDLPLSAPTGSDGGAPDPILLLRFLLFLGYRRIRPGNVLDHPVRRDLSAAVAADPGLDLAGCVAATGANRETLRYHLSLLVVSGKVTEETRNGSVRYFPHDPALTPVHRAVLHYRRTPSLAPLLNHIRDAPGISRRELAARLDLAGPTVTRQVQRLVDEGLVEPRRCGRSQRYWLTPPCTEAFAAVEAVGPVQGETVRAFDLASA